MGLFMEMRIMNKFILAGVILLLSACTDVDEASKTIRAYEMEPVEVGGYGGNRCGYGEYKQTKFTAVTTEGTHLSGIICSGFFSRPYMKLFKENKNV